MNQTIIGRIAEIRELEEAYASSQAEFLTIYGRRRVGKTFLVVNTLRGRKGIYFHATGIKKGTVDVQLEQFTQELSRTFYPGVPIEKPDDWMSAFELLTQAIARQPRTGKVVVFLDELPWMATHRSRLLQALEYFWNLHWSNDPRIKLVVCGSSASWIMRKILKNRGGLHNRVTRRMNLKPFSLQETFEFLKHSGYSINHEQALRTYMAVGGVPFYLKQFKKTQSVDQNIARLLFAPDGALFDEFDEIFSSLFDHAEYYKELVVLIARRQEGMFRQEIEAQSKLTGKGGMLTRRLEDLEAAGFIASHATFHKKSRGTLYRLSDEYCYLYLDWIQPIKDQLKSDPDASYWRAQQKTPRHYAWQGYAFENICYKHLAKIKKALKISGFAPASSWRHVVAKGTADDGAQIDLLFDRDDDSITLCEIKFADKPFVIDKRYAKVLLHKKECFIRNTGTQKQVFMALIAPHGIADNLYADEITGGVVTLADLF